jgi:polysaccharide export outer membrane protein
MIIYRSADRKGCKKMRKPQLTFLLSLMITAFILGGCGSTHQAVVEHIPTPPSAGTETAVEVATQNLSMAKKLKNLPRTEYLLGPEDTVEISVFRQDDLKMQTTVSPLGKISYYLIDDIQAGGLTQFQLRDKIKEELAKLRITEYRSHKVFVLGQVTNPGVFHMRNDFTLVEAISAAGGVASDAYLGGAYAVRDREILLVNFYKLIEEGNMGENIPLMPNDVIYIPDNKDQRVFVLGEVNKQSAIPTRDGLTLLAAIAEAGGFTHDANKGAILVMRGNLSEPQIMRIDCKRMDLSANVPLERGDIIYVASSGFANVERTALRISHILQPFLQVARGVILTDAAVEVLGGADSRFILGE